MRILRDNGLTLFLPGRRFRVRANHDVEAPNRTLINVTVN